MRDLLSRYKLAAIFFAAFAIAFAVQLHYWMKAGLTDETNWSTAAQETEQEGIARPMHEYGPATLEADPAFLYPGATIIIPVALLDHFGMKSTIAMRGGFSAVMAFLIACAVAAFAWVRPRILWWLPAAAILIFGPFYFTTTLGSAATVPLFALVTALFLKIAESREKPPSPFLLVAAGAAGGLALATRLDLSAILLAPGLVMLWSIDRRSALTVALASFIAFFVFDPFSWQGPIGYLVAVHAQMIRQEHVLFDGALLWSEEFVLPIPLASISFALFALVLAWKRKFLPIPWRVAAWLIVATLLTCIVIVSASSRRLWYFYAYFALWEALLPLIVGSLIESLPQDSPRGKQALLYLMTAALVFAYMLPVAF